jgi:hypothetical protein
MHNIRPAYGQKYQLTVTRIDRPVRPAASSVTDRYRNDWHGFNRTFLILYPQLPTPFEPTVGMMCQMLGVPLRIQVYKGSEFISKTFDKWAYEVGA